MFAKRIKRIRFVNADFEALSSDAKTSGAPTWVVLVG